MASFRFKGNCLGLAFVACKSRGYAGGSENDPMFLLYTMGPQQNFGGWSITLSDSSPENSSIFDLNLKIEYMGDKYFKQ